MVNLKVREKLLGTRCIVLPILLRYALTCVTKASHLCLASCAGFGRVVNLPVELDGLGEMR